ncbi:SDR family NAD(P)-dependent oxidoreductase [uncultured Anaerovibrio sp.]|uniref:SDR family NAD(P)-dependent oxidoreductase n=1 Tax=uncultured Anaerovibrio sp. TaxID=361586 RepID=UPI002606DE5F|nr:SDR family oxidoreductase [uncultured Anaerovibrio sp.]
MSDFTRKIALITGGTSGIGGATSILLARTGAEVIIVGRNQERGLEQENFVIAEGGQIKFFHADVSNLDDIENFRLFVEKEYGRLDMLFKNAGILLTGSLEELTDEEWDRSYDVNVKAVMHMCKSFMPLLKKSKGVVLNNASINGLHSYIKGRRSYMYATSKAANIQLTKYLAKNYAPYVRVNAICPGMTETNLFTNRDFSRFKDVNMLGRMADPMEIAKVAVFLLSDDSSFMTGSVVVVDGGETLK